jgi:hypothetical protein
MLAHNQHGKGYSGLQEDIAQGVTDYKKKASDEAHTASDRCCLAQLIETLNNSSDTFRFRHATVQPQSHSVAAS